MIAAHHRAPANAVRSVREPNDRFVRYVGFED